MIDRAYRANRLLGIQIVVRDAGAERPSKRGAVGLHMVVHVVLIIVRDDEFRLHFADDLGMPSIPEKDYNPRAFLRATRWTTTTIITTVTT